MTDTKEMTAPYAPTAICAEQSFSDNLIIPDFAEDFNPSAEEMYEAQMEYDCQIEAEMQAEKENSPSYLPTVSMPELYDMIYPGKPPVIDKFLYPGTYLFVGAPKVGKSFMMAQIAYHVSSGKPMWNYAVRQGTVLYLALEDDYKRLQERLYRMFGTETTPNLFFSVASKSLNGGLLEQLDGFLAEHPDTAVVIIDTLQKIRESEGDTYSYGKDYDIIAQLKAFSDKTGICLLLVHHTRKQKSDDNFDRISGTNGLLGAADGAFIMYKAKRADADAVIEMSGRDQPDKKINLKRNRETLCWDFDKEFDGDFKPKPEPILEAIGKLVNAENPEWKGTATELLTALALDMQPNALSAKLNINAGRLYAEYYVQYQNKRSHGCRRIELHYDADHPIVIRPDLTVTDDDEENPHSTDGTPVVVKQMVISSDTINDIAGSDYDERYREMLEHCLG